MKSPCLRIAICLLTGAGVLIVAPMSRGDEIATMYQYELRFGSNRPTGTFYLSYQHVDAGGAGASRAGLASGQRLALYSTEPATPTAFRMFSSVFQLAGPPDTTTGSAAPVSAGQVLGGALAFAYVGASLARAYKEIRNAVELDYSYGASGLETPAATKPRSPDSANGK